MTLAARLLTGAQGGGGISLPDFPTDWGVERYASNPVIDVDNNPNETTEQYVPAPIRLPNGDVWVYVKGLDRIYAWKSTDGGETFALQNSTNAVLAPGSSGAWDDEFAVDPAATYDPDTGTIHLYYKGYNGSVWSIGHATADDSDPTSFTKDAGNPILSNSTVNAALSITATDLSINNVVKIGSTFHYYGFVEYGGTYRLIQATGADWDDPSGLEVIYSAATAGHSVVISPSVFRTASGLYAMFYSIGGAQPDARWIRVASSPDAATWDFSDTTNIISPQGTGWEEDETYAGSFLRSGFGPTAYLNAGRIMFYYSGLETPPGDANVGLIYMEPS